mgnify:CR=1 FL=1
MNGRRHVRPALAMVAVLVAAVGLAACGGATGARLDSAASSADSVARAQAAEQKAAAEAAAQAARETTYTGLVNDAEVRVVSLAKAARAWVRTYKACIDQSQYIDDFGPCWSSTAKTDGWYGRARIARDALAEQVSSEVTSPSCNASATDLDNRIADLSSAWDRFEETVNAQSVDLANAARVRALEAADAFFAEARSYSRVCDSPSDVK